MSQYLIKLFRYARSADELNPVNMQYTGMLSYGEFLWRDTMREPWFENKACGFLLHHFLFRFGGLVAATVLVGLEEQADKDMRPEGNDAVMFPFRPNQLIWLFMCSYVVLTFILFAAGCTTSCDSTSVRPPVPYLYRFAWFCYDMALPGSLSALVLYLILRKNTAQPQTIAWSRQNGVADKTTWSYACNAIVMLLDMLTGRMILLPAHFYNFLVFWTIYSVAMLAVFYPLPVQPVQGAFLLLVSVFFYSCIYVILYFFTHFRAYATGASPFPIQEFAGGASVYSKRTAPMAAGAPEGDLENEG